MKIMKFMLFVTLYAAIGLSAFSLTGCKATQKGDATADSVKTENDSILLTDSIAFLQKGSSGIECSITVDYPTADDQLSEGVRKYIASQLSATFLPQIYSEDGTADKYRRYSGSTDDGKAMVNHYGKVSAAFLSDQINELKENGVADVPGMDFTLSIRKTEETPRYVNYETTVNSYLGGAHGSCTTYTATISKQSTLPVACTVDTLKTAALQPLLRKGVMAYLKDCGGTSVTDKTLNDFLFIENGTIPVPQYPPYITHDGIHFIYQQSEIGPYALGMVTFTVPFKEIKSFLTKDALELLP